MRHKEVTYFVINIQDLVNFMHFYLALITCTAVAIISKVSYGLT